MIENSYIEINLKALTSNIQFIKEKIGKQCEMVSVVKGNAYGHGIASFVPAANVCGVRSFAVFSAFEAKKVHDLHLDIDRIIIMGYLDNDQVEWAIQNEIEFYVFDIDRLNLAIESAKNVGNKAKIHLEIETGLNRTGFIKDDLKKVYRIVQSNTEHLEIQGICSHLAGAENIANYYRIKKQISRFNHACKNFGNQNIDITHRHLACSAAIINYPKTILDLARVGIMQYGLWPSKEVKMAYFVRNKVVEDPLQPVLSWKSKVMSTKRVKMGEYIGYGSSLQAENDMQIATFPVGYADGFARSLSNQGKVLIKGQRLDVIGIVNMNLTIVDITNTEGVKKGDEVVLIGQQEDGSISIASFSDFSNQLNYELLTRLPNDIPRLITN